mgnify:CR=1 FL=1
MPTKGGGNVKVSEDMNQFEVINNTIDYYKNLQAIKRANTCENRVLDYEIKTTRVKLESFGINLHDLEFEL